MLCNCNLVALSPFQLFRTPLPPPQPFCNHPFVFCVFEFVFILLFKFYIWVRLCGICVSLWLTSLSIEPSRSVCVVTSGNFFFLWLMFHCIFFIHSCISGYLDFLHILATVNILQWTLESTSFQISVFVFKCTWCKILFLALSSIIILDMFLKHFILNSVICASQIFCQH